MSDSSFQENNPERVDISSLAPSFTSVIVNNEKESYPNINQAQLERIIGRDKLFNTLKLSEHETTKFIRKLHAGVAGGLAVTLWLGLLATGIWHTHSVGFITKKMLGSENLLGSNGDRPDLEIYDKAIAVVGDTSKTLFAIITPLATAVTGFYFVVDANRESKSKKDDEE